MYRISVNPAGTFCIAHFGTNWTMDTNRTYVERLRYLRERDHLDSAADAARAYGLNENTFKSIANGTRNLTPEQAVLIAKHHHVSPGWLLFAEGNPDGRDIIPISGFVAAGQNYTVYDTSDNGLETTTLNLGAEGTIAVEVRGDSMLPAYRSGDVVFAGPFTKSLDNVLGDECLVLLEDGRRLLKIIEKGSRPGTVTLISWNTEPIRDVDMHSAAPVIGVKRSRNRVRKIARLSAQAQQTEAK